MFARAFSEDRIVVTFNVQAGRDMVNRVLRIEHGGGYRFEDIPGP